MDKHVKRDIVRASESIKKKSKRMRLGLIEEEEKANKQFLPLLKPLNTLIDLTGAASPSRLAVDAPIKTEGVKQAAENESPKELEKKKRVILYKPKAKAARQIKSKGPLSKFKAIPEDVFESAESSDGEEDEGVDEGGNANFQMGYYDPLSEVGELAREYLTGLEEDSMKPYKQRRYDITFGFRKRGPGQWSIGNAEAFFGRDDSIHLGADAWWRGTRGLYELLFKKLPINYTKDDEQKYKDILSYSSAHLHNYDARARVASSYGKKYMSIIRPLFQDKLGYTKRRKGGSFLPLTNNSIDYVHWDDPNELVERLALLISSREAGNGGHAAEIASIEEELREGNYIE